MIPSSNGSRRPVVCGKMRVRFPLESPHQWLQGNFRADRSRFFHTSSAGDERAEALPEAPGSIPGMEVARFRDPHPCPEVTPARHFTTPRLGRRRPVITFDAPLLRGTGFNSHPTFAPCPTTHADVVQQPGFLVANERTMVQVHPSAPHSGIPTRQRNTPQKRVSVGSNPTRSISPSAGRPWWVFHPSASLAQTDTYVGRRTRVLTKLAPVQTHIPNPLTEVRA